MLRQEWKALCKNKFMLVVLVAIITIPTIYTSIFLGSMWDPYGEVEHLPVAVVNNDKSTEYEGETVEVGKELVDKLKDEKPLGFNFVSAETAATGLENGTYYMVITIPEDFSYNATTILDENPKKMELSYDTNPGTNYIASKMSETAVNKIRTSVAEQVTNKYAEVIVEKFGTINDGLIDATDGTKELDEGAEKLKDGSTTLAKNLNTLAESTLTFKDGANTLAVSLGTYTDGVGTVNDGANKLKDGVDLLSSKTGALSDGANQLNSGSAALKEGVVSYTGAVGQLSDGTSKLAANNAALNVGVGTVAEGLKTLNAGSAGALAGLNKMSASLAEGLSEENAKQLAVLKGGLNLANSEMKDANDALAKVDTDKLGLALDSIVSETKNSKTYVDGIGADVDTAVSAIEKSDAFKTLSDSQKKEILDAVKGIKAGDNYAGAKTSTITADATIAGVKQQLSEAGIKDLSKIDSTKESIGLLVEKDVLGNAVGTIDNMVYKLQLIQTNLDQVGKTPETMGLIQVMKAVDDGATKLNAGVNGQEGLQSKVQTYTGVVDTVNTGLNTLDSKSSDLTAGTVKLDAGISAIASKVPMLTDAMGTLQGGLVSLTDGTGKLVSNNGKLMDGANKLADGANKIEDASGKLADGANTLEEGMGTLTDGTSELHDKIADSSKELDDTIKPTGKHTSDMISEPVITANTEASSVANNGSAMAAYMMGVGLWVGCLAFSIMFSLDQPAGKITSGISWWFSKASMGGLIAVCQPVVMVFALKGILGFNPASLGKTILIAELASIAFMSIFYLFNVLLGKVGSFFLLIFMVLQLGGSAGTYPIELSSGFYQAIHPFMPFTYSVNAFRATIASGQSITTSIIVFISIFAVATALTIGVFEIKARRALAREDEMELDAVLE